MGAVTAFKSMDALNGFVAARQIDRADGYVHSQRGFNTSMRVSSDRPSRVKLWSAGTSVGFQRTTFGAETPEKAYQRKYREANETHKRRVPECVWTDIGSTMRDGRMTSLRAEQRRIYANAMRGVGSVEAMVFGD